MVVTEGENKLERVEKIIGEIMTKKFPKLIKDMNMDIQEAPGRSMNSN